MVYPLATRLIKCDVQTDIKGKWSDFVDGGNGCLYGIPWNARRVVEFHVEDESIKEIGPDLGNQCGKYINGIKAGNGSIYCMPHNTKDFLKIIPGEGQNAEVKMLHLREQEIPSGDWMTGALANDGCIYYFPDCHRGRILKLDPSDGDSLSLVGEELYADFEVAVFDNDGYIYGISDNEINKFNPIDHRVSYIGRSFEHDNHFWRGAVLAEDGNIYAANQHGQILIIDTSENDWKIIGSEIYHGEYARSWGNAVLGADKCIYFSPLCHDRVLRYNPTTQSISLIGESYGEKEWKWRGAVLASDGHIYCIPYGVDNILLIDSRLVNDKVLEMMKNHVWIITSMIIIVGAILAADGNNPSIN